MKFKPQSLTMIYIGNRKKNYTFIPTSLFRDRSLFRGFNDKNIQNHRLYTFRLHRWGKFKFKCLVVT